MSSNLRLFKIELGRIFEHILPRSRSDIAVGLHAASNSLYSAGNGGISDTHANASAVRQFTLSAGDGRNIHQIDVEYKVQTSASSLTADRWLRYYWIFQSPRFIIQQRSLGLYSVRLPHIGYRSFSNLLVSWSWNCMSRFYMNAKSRHQLMDFVERTHSYYKCSIASFL